MIKRVQKKWFKYVKDDDINAESGQLSLSKLSSKLLNRTEGSNLNLTAIVD